MTTTTSRWGGRKSAERRDSHVKTVRWPQTKHHLFQFRYREREKLRLKYKLTINWYALDVGRSKVVPDRRRSAIRKRFYNRRLIIQSSEWNLKINSVALKIISSMFQKDEAENSRILYLEWDENKINRSLKFHPFFHLNNVERYDRKSQMEKTTLSLYALQFVRAHTRAVCISLHKYERHYPVSSLKSSKLDEGWSNLIGIMS